MAYTESEDITTKGFERETEKTFQNSIHFI